MCGRFSLRLDRREIRDLPGYNVDIDEWVDEEAFVPRYNIAPRTQAPVIRHRDAGSAAGSGQESNGRPLILHTMKWGLVPHWSKFEDKTLSTTNARSENLVEGGGMWGSIKGKKRCAIPVQGYFEWLSKGKDKLPHFTKRKDGLLLLLAGLYDCAVIDGKALWTFTIVTTDANKEFSWLHDRQPVFLSNIESLNRWLNTSSQTWTPELTEMVKPYSDTDVPLNCYQVPKEVGKVGMESSSFIEPVANRKGGIESMFSKQRLSQRQNTGKRDFETGYNRKRSHSPPPTSNPKSNSENSPNRKIKAEDAGESNLPTEEGFSKQDKKEVKIVQAELKGKSSPKKSRQPKKEIESSPGSSKITSFFGKT